MPRKHLIASGINKKQQYQAKLWMKAAKEIKAATKVGGPNPDSNPRLKAAIARGLNCNLSRDSIQKNINGATKDESTLKDSFYEAYGPNGVGILIKTLTDNDQRTISAIRGYISKLGGQLAKPNSVMILFDELGEFIIESNKFSEDQILEATIENEITDLLKEDEYYILYSKPNDFFNIKDNLEKQNISFINSEIKYIPNQTVELANEYMDKMNKFMDTCENDEDISWIVTNID